MKLFFSRRSIFGRRSQEKSSGPFKAPVELELDLGVLRCSGQRGERAGGQRNGRESGNHAFHEAVPFYVDGGRREDAASRLTGKPPLSGKVQARARGPGIAQGPASAVCRLPRK